MIKIFDDYIPNVGDVFTTNAATDSGLIYTILESTNGESIRFKRSDGGVGNWSQQKFNEYIKEERLILQKNV